MRFGSSCLKDLCCKASSYCGFEGYPMLPHLRGFSVSRTGDSPQFSYRGYAKLRNRRHLTVKITRSKTLSSNLSKSGYGGYLNRLHVSYRGAHLRSICESPTLDSIEEKAGEVDGSVWSNGDTQFRNASFRGIQMRNLGYRLSTLCLKGYSMIQNKLHLSLVGANSRSFSGGGSSYDMEEKDVKSESERDDDFHGADDDGDGSGVVTEDDSEGYSTSNLDSEKLDRVCKVVEELFASDRNMEAVLDQCGIDLTSEFVMGVLTRFKHERRPAFRFFSWAGGKSGYQHDSRSYNVMISILGKTRQFESMVAMLEEMGQKKVLNLKTFTIAVRTFATAREMKKAVGVFELMKKHKFGIGTKEVNHLLDALGRAKLVKEAQSMFEKLMLRCKFIPDMQTYTVLLSGWCKRKNLIEAGRVWNEMIDIGLKPDIVAHNIMLEGLLVVKRLSDGVKMFELMKAKGPAPSVRTFTIMIRDLCKWKKLEEAVAYYNELLDAGLNPDPAVYTSLIIGFGKQRKMVKVYELLKEMKRSGAAPDGRTYNALIKLTTTKGMSEDAVQIYKRMIQTGNEPTIHTYNMMIKASFLSGDHNMGCAVWEEMARKGFCPDDNSYTVFIGGLIRHGRSEEVCMYVEKMIDKGIKAPQLDINKFAANYYKAGKPDILQELAQKMSISGKFDVANVFERWSQMLNRRVKRR